MLGKLIKYDLKFIYKQLVIFYCIIVLSAIITRLTDFDSNVFIIRFIHEFALGCTFGFAFGTYINGAMRTWYRLRQNFYGSESYLTHTLPVSRETLWAAKFISSIIAIFTSIIVCLVGFLIMFFSQKLLREWCFDDPTTVLFYALFILTVFCQIVYIVQSGLTGIILGHLHNNNRRVLSIVYGIVVYYIGSMVIIATALIWSQIDPEIHKAIFSGGMSLDTLNRMLIGFCITYIVLITTTYCINSKLLARGVNVD